MNEMRMPAPPRADAAAGNMPPEAPLDMPVQSLSKFDQRARHRDPRARFAFGTWMSRLAVFGGGLALTIYLSFRAFQIVDWILHH